MYNVKLAKKVQCQCNGTVTCNSTYQWHYRYMYGNTLCVHVCVSVGFTARNSVHVKLGDRPSEKKSSRSIEKQLRNTMSRSVVRAICSLHSDSNDPKFSSGFLRMIRVREF